jgi:glyceraldehyde 3-phosphate dehydrogenase
MLKMLDDKFGVKRAMMTTVHAYTSDQPLADTAQSDLRRSRSAVENIIPNKTWAPELVGKLMPQFEGKVEGTAFNVPVPDGSAVDLTTDLENLPSVEEANEAIQTFADGALNGIVGFTDDPIVSSDVIGRSETMLYDAKATMITANKLLKTVCWYDNGWGFSARILELIESYQTLENEGGES